MMGRMLTTVGNKGRYLYARDGDIVEVTEHKDPFDAKDVFGLGDKCIYRVTAINGLLTSTFNPIIVDIRNDFEFVPSEEFQ